MRRPKDSEDIFALATHFEGVPVWSQDIEGYIN